jgi:hypothetical protein
MRNFIPVATSIRWYATIVAMALIISFPQTRAQTISPRTFPSFNCDRSSSVPIDLVSPEARSIVVDPNQDDCSWPSRDDRNHHLIFGGGFGGVGRVPQTILHVPQLDEEQYRLANRDDEQTDCECTRRILRKPRPPSFLGVLFVLFATAGAAFGFFYGLCRLCGLTPTPGHRLREKYRDD